MRLANAWDWFWFAETPLMRLAVFRILLLLLTLYDVVLGARVIFLDAAGRSGVVLSREWQPIYAFELLGLGPPNLLTARALYAILLTAIVLGVLGLFTRGACAVVAGLTFYWAGLRYGFGQVHHEKVALMFALLALPLAPVGTRLSLDAVLARRRRAWGHAPGARPVTSPFAGWPLRLTQVTIAIGYFFAGASKLVIAGPAWLNGYTLQGIMLGTSAPWAMFFAHSVLLCSLMSLGLVFVQVTFPLVFVWPGLRWFYLPAATLFHLLAWKTMHTGLYIQLWFTLLICFIPWERVLTYVGQLWRADTRVTGSV